MSAAGEAGQTPTGERAPLTGEGSQPPSEDELRAAYEAELSRVTATDMMAQATVTLLNIGARRLAPIGEEQGAPGQPGGESAPARDLEQARDAIDAARALLEILERRIPQELRPLRDALSRLQMTYAREVGAGGAGAAERQPAGAARDAEGEPAPSGEGRPPGPGPAEASGRLWVPGR